MNAPAVVPIFQTSLEDFLIQFKQLFNAGSLLGRIIAAAAARQQVTDPSRIMPTFEIVAQRDYLAELHSLSGFPAYTSAPTHRNDEPLFTFSEKNKQATRKRTISMLSTMVEGRKPVVEHKTFGLGLLLYIGESIGGSPVFDVQFLDGQRTVTAYWLTGIEKHLQKWWKRMTGDFKFTDYSPSKMDGGYHAMPIDVHVVAPAPRFHQVTPEDVAWAERQSAFPRERLMSPAELAKFFEDHRKRREAQYTKQHELQVLAHSLGDEWATTHPEMEASMSFFAPAKLTLIAAARERALRSGGKRVMKTSFAAEDDSQGKNGANWDGPGDKSGDCLGRGNYKKERSKDYQPVPPKLAACLYCGKELAARKGTKYCLRTDHRQRHWDQQHSKENIQ